MNKQLVQDIIKAGNKAMDVVVKASHQSYMYTTLIRTRTHAYLYINKYII